VGDVSDGFAHFAFNVGREAGQCSELGGLRTGPNHDKGGNSVIMAEPSVLLPVGLNATPQKEFVITICCPLRAIIIEEMSAPTEVSTPFGGWGTQQSGPCSTGERPQFYCGPPCSCNERSHRQRSAIFDRG
jgi:hypothetical protein